MAEIFTYWMQNSNTPAYFLLIFTVKLAAKALQCMCMQVHQCIVRQIPQQDLCDVCVEEFLVSDEERSHLKSHLAKL